MNEGPDPAGTPPGTPPGTTAGTTAERPVVRVRTPSQGPLPSPAPDALAVEEPLEIRLAGRPIAVVMRTPGRDADLVRGFLVSEGVVERESDIAGIGPARDPAGDAVANALDVALAPGLAVDLASLERNLFASSSCGICGKASIEGVIRRAPPFAPGPVIARATITGLPHTMRAGQAAFARTGGLHAAAAFDAGGALLAIAEDVGRHNAVDKVLGALCREHTAAAGAALMVSGRASFEIVQKALFGRIPIVCAVSAPTSLAADAAREANQTLVGFLRGDAFNIYAGPERISP